MPTAAPHFTTCQCSYRSTSLGLSFSSKRKRIHVINATYLLAKLSTLVYKFTSPWCCRSNISFHVAEGTIASFPLNSNPLTRNISPVNNLSTPSMGLDNCRLQITRCRAKSLVAPPVDGQGCFGLRLLTVSLPHAIQRLLWSHQKTSAMKLLITYWQQPTSYWAQTGILNRISEVAKTNVGDAETFHLLISLILPIGDYGRFRW